MNKKEEQALKKNFSSIFWQWETLTQLYGDQVSSYFQFLQHYTLALFPLACFGGGIYLFDTRYDDDINSAIVVAYASVVCLLWAPVTVGWWSRKERASRASTSDESARRVRIRRRPSGHVRSNLTQFFVYLMGGVISVCFLGVAALLMLVCLNFDGYFLPDSPVYLSFANNWRHPDHPGLVHISDPVFVQYLPTVFHSLLIFCTNYLYSLAAEKLTELENHEFVDQHEKSVILKRVPFEFADCFLSLMYLMIWQRDITQLRHELLGLFLTDTVRRLLVESVLPFTQHRLQTKFQGPSPKEEYQESFDDFIEILVQFGYLVLFASVFPFASLLAFLANMIEARSDLFKLVFIFKPSSSLTRERRTGQLNIGIWLSMFKFVTYAGVLTNAILFAYTTDQVEDLFLGDHARSIFGGHNATSMFILFSIEHGGLFIVWLIFFVFQAWPLPVTVKEKIK